MIFFKFGPNVNFAALHLREVGQSDIELSFKRNFNTNIATYLRKTRLKSNISVRFYLGVKTYRLDKSEVFKSIYNSNELSRFDKDHFFV